MFLIGERCNRAPPSNPLKEVGDGVSGGMGLLSEMGEDDWLLALSRNAPFLSEEGDSVKSVLTGELWDDGSTDGRRGSCLSGAPLSEMPLLKGRASIGVGGESIEGLRDCLGASRGAGDPLTGDWSVRNAGTGNILRSTWSLPLLESGGGKVAREERDPTASEKVVAIYHRETAFGPSPINAHNRANIAKVLRANLAELSRCSKFLL
mmetsp:Transcript_12160/g.20645  ORF Transcript_12160/g.20645 Transcript_12160/m.20645 type:complete len:207 (+) Transcript_12160:856-1476(+)